MGKAKSKAANECEETILSARQSNVNKLIQRMNSGTEVIHVEETEDKKKDRAGLSRKKRSWSFRKRKGEDVDCVDNNNLDVNIHQNPVQRCALDTCNQQGTAILEDFINSNESHVVISKKENLAVHDISVDVGRETRDDDVEERISKKSGGCQMGRERADPTRNTQEPNLTLNLTGTPVEDNVEPSLLDRLEELEKRTCVFEKNVDKLGEWLDSHRQNAEDDKTDGKSQPSSPRSEEFEKNMLKALRDDAGAVETLKELKTIERVSPSRSHSCAGSDRGVISAPKADPIIRNTIEKLLQDKEKVKGGKTYCQSCRKKCSGEVLRVQEKYFHISCFKCKACKNSLAQGGFFCKDGAYYCTNDYQRQFGTRCAHCGEYVEGEVVTALGNTYHQKCFTCARCRQAFPSGERVTYTGKEVLCQKCVQIPIRDTRSPAVSPGANECAGCGDELKDGQALIALERQWHIWCFKCKTCDSVLHGEYMGKDGIPYCEKDYQKQFGVKCAYCCRFISGKVLQAGDNHHFHPTCARCTKCGDPFGDGEEMYLQGGAIWHPRCGPGPTENGTVVNGSTVLENGHCTDTDGELSGREGPRDAREFDRMSSSAFSFRSRTPSMNGSLGSPCNSLKRKYGGYQRTGSPGLILREYKSQQQFSEDISRIYTYSYLTEEPSHGYLKRPIDPYDKPPTSPHFHRPHSAHSQRSGTKVLVKTGSRSGMKVMAESIRSETPRPKSPHMNNEEPIELAHFPDAKKPKPGQKPKIERDDFPAPPYPYTDPERRKRWSDSYKGVSDDEDQTDAKDKEAEDAKLKREEEELSKIATGIGKVFLQNVKEREKLRQWKQQHLDPRNASRVPSANKEPAYRLRYQSPVNASPSRNMDHPRPWEEDEAFQDRSSSYRSSVGRSIGAIPSYNATSTSTSRLGYSRPGLGKAFTLPGRHVSGYSSDYGVGYNVSRLCGEPVQAWSDLEPLEKVVSALRHIPKPGYGLAPRSHTFSSTGGSVSNVGGDFSFSGFGEKTHSTEFSSGKSDISGGSIPEVDRRALNADMPVSTTFQYGLRYSSYSPHLRRSLPTLSHMNNEPPKIYPYHLLLITNYRLPADVDRCNLERHMSDSEFEQRFQCSRAEFYRLPQWRRNDMKRRIRLF